MDKPPEQLAAEWYSQMLKSGRDPLADEGFLAGYNAAETDEDMSYRRGYLDGMIDSQAKAAKLESFMKGFEKGMKQFRASNPPKEEK